MNSFKKFQQKLGNLKPAKHRAEAEELNRDLNEVYAWNKFRMTDQPIRVALIVRDGLWWPKSSAFVRLLSPLTSPGLQGEIGLRILGEDTVDIGDANICLVQRNAYDDIQSAKELVSYLRERKIPLIVDTDDAFHDIDKSHPEYNLQRQRLDAFEFLIASAQQIWVSTPRLAKYFKKETKAEVRVILNSLDKRLWYSNKESAMTKKPLRIIYMGTGSHDADFEMLRPSLRELAVAYPKSFELTLIGAVSKPVDEPWLKRLVQPPFMGSLYLKFVPWFLEQGPFDIGLAPLVNSEFNRSKSDIKCLDYLAAGILPVVSDVEPYKSVELSSFIIRVENSQDGWLNTLTELVKNKKGSSQKNTKIVKAGQNYLWSERNSTETGQQLYRLLQRVIRV